MILVYVETDMDKLPVLSLFFTLLKIDLSGVRAYYYADLLNAYLKIPVFL